ncbi:MAG: dienelactone hydrolase family protein [Planctomycetota bacterium]|nr:dienelactone hydrolase family protein [Planctomycetota bacterium]
MKWYQLPLLVLALSGAAVRGEIQTRAIEYRDQDVTLAGHLAWDDAVSGKRPGILVVHEWWGLNNYARSRAEQLAKLGYVAFALDMYGKGKLTEHPQQAGEWASAIRKNTQAWQQRARAGLDVLRQQATVDHSQLAAIGYCFGGSTVLQLAYGGEPLRGVVSFHGSLPVASPAQLKKLTAGILVCHGAADAFIPAEQIDKFRGALSQSSADWQMIYYAGARHSFTNPGADQRGIENIKYDKRADQRSWSHMKTFFAELFR